MMHDPFDGLEAVPWHLLRTADGHAGHVPQALRNLVGADARRRDAAYWQLDNHVVRQGDLYPAAEHVVPFLLRIIAVGRLEGRTRVYDLLFEIGNGGAPPDWLTQPLDGSPPSPLAQACRAHVLAGEHLYLVDAAGATPEVRAKAMELLGSLTEHAATLLPKLRALRSPDLPPPVGKALDEAIQSLEEG